MITELGSKIIELREQGMPVKKIARHLGCSASTTSKWCALARNTDDIMTRLRTLTDAEVEQIRRKRDEGLLASVSKGGMYSSNWCACRRESSKAWLMLSADTACQRCGYQRALRNLVFHHLKEKVFGLAGRGLLYPPKRLFAEARKCVVLCHNCHGELHEGVFELTGPLLDPQPFPESLFEWYREWLPQNRPLWVATSEFAKLFSLAI